MRRPHAFKAQSAMEYLMTYGWAILIIAVMLAALYNLGIFSSTFFVPKVPPGSCQVLKVGSGSAQDISIEGTCSGQLPQYVGSFSGGGYIGIAAPSSMPSKSTFTISAWADYFPPSNCNWGNIVETNQFDFEKAGLTGTCSGTIIRFIPSIDGGFVASSAFGFPMNKWNFITVTVNAVSTVLYVNGTAVETASGMSNSLAINGIRIGMAGLTGIGYSDGWTGYISNVQIYNTSLSPSEVNALYLEGIGGAPINPQYIVGWWPLNGNAQDYSGNNNNGQPNTGLSYSSFWTNGYTAP